MSDPVLRLKGVAKTFYQGDKVLEVLRDASLSMEAGELVALVGPSGAGKSTFLHIAGLLERPDTGEIVICGESCTGLSEDRTTLLRRTAIGFVYQFHHLLPEFSALENVVLPQMIKGENRAVASTKASALLTEVGLAERLRHRPARLSGGERQRVAIARALANSPALLIADEPTGNLDQETAGSVFEMLMRLTRTSGISALVATHNMELASRMDRQLVLRNGRLTDP